MENLVSDPDVPGVHLKFWSLDGSLMLTASVQAGPAAHGKSILAISGSRPALPARGLVPGNEQQELHACGSRPQESLFSSKRNRQGGRLQ